jgi:CO/xanthine dehydrogenase Mo-binding subunit
MIMGIGMALTEETLFDERSGRIMSASMADYHVPVHLDVPEIDVFWTDIPDPRSPMGARGIGEIGITGVAPAIANAVFNATGPRVRDLPLTPDKLLSVGATYSRHTHQYSACQLADGRAGNLMKSTNARSGAGTSRRPG